MLSCSMLTYNTIEIVPVAVPGFFCMPEVNLTIVNTPVSNKMVISSQMIRLILRLEKPDYKISLYDKNISYRVTSRREILRFLKRLLSFSGYNCVKKRFFPIEKIQVLFKNYRKFFLI